MATAMALRHQIPGCSRQALRQHRLIHGSITTSMAEPSRPSPVRTPEVFDGARSVEYDPDDDIYLVFYADGTAKAWAERSYGFWLEVPIPTDRPNAD